MAGTELFSGFDVLVTKGMDACWEMLRDEYVSTFRKGE